jgi:hypothetical protein
MTVGQQISKAIIDTQITNLSLNMRSLMYQITNLSQNVTGQGAGLATLEAAGYDSGDAAGALAAISYLNTIASVYFGTAAQTPEFDFNQELSQYWGGQ